MIRSSFACMLALLACVYATGQSVAKLNLETYWLRAPVWADGTIGVGDTVISYTSILYPRGYTFRSPQPRLVIHHELSLMFTGKDADGTLYAASAARPGIGSDFRPMVTTGGHPLNLLWKVNRSDIERHIELMQEYVWDKGIDIPLGLIPGGIREWPGGNNPYTLASDGTPIQVDLAPWLNIDGYPGYRPERGDIPWVHGDQSILALFQTRPDSVPFTYGNPLLLDVRLEASLLDSNSLLRGATFYQYTIVNRGPDLDSTYMGMRFGHLYAPHHTDTLRQALAYFTSETTTWGRMHHAVVWLTPHVSSAYSLNTTFRHTNRNSYGAAAMWDDLNTHEPDICKRLRIPFESGGPSNCNICGQHVYPSTGITMGSTPFAWKHGEEKQFEFAVVSYFCNTMVSENCPDPLCLRLAIDAAIGHYRNAFPTGVAMDAERPVPTVYPNPTRGLLYIRWPHPAPPGTLELLNHTGQRVAAWPAPVTQIHIGHLPAGWYLLRFQNSRETWQAPVVKY